MVMTGLGLMAVGLVVAVVGAFGVGVPVTDPGRIEPQSVFGSFLATP
jgi:hypothetical protein